jgi:RNA polymerase sigma factor (sigma-70 family)
VPDVPPRADGDSGSIVGPTRRASAARQMFAVSDPRAVEHIGRARCHETQGTRLARSIARGPVGSVRSPVPDRGTPIPAARTITRRSSCNSTNTEVPSIVYQGVTDSAAGVFDSIAANDTADHDRLANLFDTHHRRLYRLARRMTGSADEARDVVQDTFVKAALSLRAVPQSRGGEEAWLVRILVNLMRDRWRQRANRARLQEQYSSIGKASCASGESALIAHRAVWQALQTLAPRRRAVVVLHHLEDTPTAEIAQLLSISKVTVRWHLSRARAELSRVLQRTEEV